MYKFNATQPYAQNLRATRRVSAVAYDTRPLIATVSTHLNVAPAAITGAARNKEVARARHLVMYILHEDTWLTWCAIGRVLERDHSTIINGHAKIARMLVHDRPLRLIIAAIRHDMQYGPLEMVRPSGRLAAPAPSMPPPRPTHTERLESRYWQMQTARRAQGSASW